MNEQKKKSNNNKENITNRSLSLLSGSTSKISCAKKSIQTGRKISLPLLHSQNAWYSAWIGSKHKFAGDQIHGNGMLKLDRSSWLLYVGFCFVVVIFLYLNHLNHIHGAFLFVCLQTLCSACIVCHYYSFDDNDLITCFLATGTFVGYSIILMAVFACLLLRTRLDRKLDIFYSAIGSALFITSGVFIIDVWQYAFRTRTRDLAMLKGTLSIINGILLLLDFIFTCKDKWTISVH